RAWRLTPLLLLWRRALLALLARGDALRAWRLTPLLLLWRCAWLTLLARGDALRALWLPLLLLRCAPILRLTALVAATEALRALRHRRLLCVPALPLLLALARGAETLRALRLGPALLLLRSGSLRAGPLSLPLLLHR